MSPAVVTVNRWQTASFVVVLGLGLAATAFVEWVQYVERHIYNERHRA